MLTTGRAMGRARALVSAGATLLWLLRAGRASTALLRALLPGRRHAVRGAAAAPRRHRPRRWGHLPPPPPRAPPGRRRRRPRRGLRGGVGLASGRQPAALWTGGASLRRRRLHAALPRGCGPARRAAPGAAAARAASASGRADRGATAAPAATAAAAGAAATTRRVPTLPSGGRAGAALLLRVGGARDRRRPGAGLRGRGWRSAPRLLALLRGGRLGGAGGAATCSRRPPSRAAPPCPPAARRRAPRGGPGGRAAERDGARPGHRGDSGCVRSRAAAVRLRRLHARLLHHGAGPPRGLHGTPGRGPAAAATAAAAAAAHVPARRGPGLGRGRPGLPLPAGASPAQAEGRCAAPGAPGHRPSLRCAPEAPSRCGGGGGGIARPWCSGGAAPGTHERKQRAAGGCRATLRPAPLPRGWLHRDHGVPRPQLGLRGRPLPTPHPRAQARSGRVTAADGAVLLLRRGGCARGRHAARARSRLRGGRGNREGRRRGGEDVQVTWPHRKRVTRKNHGQGAAGPVVAAPCNVPVIGSGDATARAKGTFHTAQTGASAQSADTPAGDSHWRRGAYLPRGRFLRGRPLHAAPRLRRDGAPVAATGRASGAARAGVCPLEHPKGPQTGSRPRAVGRGPYPGSGRGCGWGGREGLGPRVAGRVRAPLQTVHEAA
eukprot:scaffold7082_cov350-Prasinococcus_capsulatus_cf.AAC.5